MPAALTSVTAANQPRHFTTISWALTVLCALALVASAATKLFAPADVRATAAATFGFPEAMMPRLAVLELACLGLYLVPRTAVLGAILLTGYLGGAVATHARVGDVALVTPVVLGVLAWLALYLRESRLRVLTPLVQDAPPVTPAAPATR